MVTDKKIVLDAAVTIKLLDRFSDLTDQMLLVDETFRHRLPKDPNEIYNKEE